MRAVTFDLYDTLVVVAPAARRAHQQDMADRIGIPLEEFLALWDTTTRASGTGVIGPTTDRVRHVLDQIPGHAGASDDLVAELADAEHRFLRSAVRVVDGIPGLLADLRSRGIRTWLVSNCSASVAHTLDASGLLPLLDGVTLSCDVGHMKPEPEIYESALTALGVAAHEAWYVADGMVDELGAATRVGMRAARVTWSHATGHAPDGVPSAATAGELTALLDLSPVPTT